MIKVFRGTASPTGHNWSDPKAWVGGAVPIGSNGLKVLLDTSSTEDIGSAQAPFLTNDVIGANIGGTLPSLSVTGFLHAHDVENLVGVFIEGKSGLSAHDIKNVKSLTVLSGPGTLDVKHDLVNVQQLDVVEESVAHVGQDLVNVDSVSLSFGGKLEVGHSLGSSQVTFGAAGGTLILDKPPHGTLSNAIALTFAQEKIELGRLTFDKAAFVANASGSTDGKIQLTEHGRPVYQLADVTLPQGATHILSVGFDRSTGFDFIAH
jgi:hypothetical protein